MLLFAVGDQRQQKNFHFTLIVQYTSISYSLKITHSVIGVTYVYCHCKRQLSSLTFISPFFFCRFCQPRKMLVLPQLWNVCSRSGDLCFVENYVNQRSGQFIKILMRSYIYLNSSTPHPTPQDGVKLSLGIRKTLETFGLPFTLQGPCIYRSGGEHTQKFIYIIISLAKWKLSFLLSEEHVLGQ